MAAATSHIPTPEPALTPPEQAAAYLDADESPKWDEIDFDVPCSRCGYDLRMLPQARCPECGLEFSWRELLVARFQRNALTFEANWRRRPMVSWLSTIWRGLRPRKFWSHVSIHEHVRAGPLWFLLLTAPLLFVAGLVSVLLLFGGLYYLPTLGREYFRWQLSTWEMQGLSRIYLDMAAMPIQLGDDDGLVFWAIMGLVWLALFCILGVVAGLRQTLGRCRVRTVLVLRVVANSAGPMCLLGGLYIALATVGWSTIEAYSRLAPGSSSELVALLLLVILPCTIPVCYVAVGIKEHLRLPRAWPISLAATVIGGLAAFTLYVVAIVATRS